MKTYPDMRDELVFARREMMETLAAHPNLKSLRARTTAIEENLIALQRATARAVPVKFAIRKVTPGK